MAEKRTSRHGVIATALLVLLVVASLLYRGTLESHDLAMICADIILVAFVVGFGVSSVRRSSGVDRVLGLAAVVLAVLMIGIVLLASVFIKAN